MESIISKEVLNQTWEIGHQRVMELESLMAQYPILTRFIRELKKDYIICLNAISGRDFNLIESQRKVIDIKENELEELIKEINEDTKRSKKAKQIIESEITEDGK